jgi:hypothetical protein
LRRWFFVTNPFYRTRESLKYLLATYNDGRRKNFFYLAVNLLKLQDVKSVVEQIAPETKSDNQTLREKATLAVSLFQSIAARRNIVLRLNKNSSKSSSSINDLKPNNINNNLNGGCLYEQSI